MHVVTVTQQFVHLGCLAECMQYPTATVYYDPYIYGQTTCVHTILLSAVAFTVGPPLLSYDRDGVCVWLADCLHCQSSIH